MALNSICASACTKAARPSTVFMARRLTNKGAIKVGFSGMPGSRATVLIIGLASKLISPFSQASANAEIALALITGLVSANKSRLNWRSSKVKLGEIIMECNCYWA